jgi:site-specific recombinase XerD
MLTKTALPKRRTLAPPDLELAFTDFILSRQAIQCSNSTLLFYHSTALVFLLWVQDAGITSPPLILPKHVRAYLAELTSKGLTDRTIHAHARAIKTLLRFWYTEKYIPEPITIQMPKLAKRKMLVLTADELNTVIHSCPTLRDKALILFMADSGLRREEISNLNRGDVDFMNGLVKVKRGKGGKFRSAVIGATTRRFLLAYFKTTPATPETPIFLSRTGNRLTGGGILLIFRRLSKSTGIHITPHSLRRTFVILSLRSGMDILHLQAILGHSDLDMVQHYAQMVDDDLLQSHKAHSPIDNLSKLK